MHAACDLSREICGLLLGCDGRIEEARPAANVAADPARTFEIDPAALFAALRSERTGGPALIGYYHSHPSGAAAPSARDLEMAAEDGKLWLIVAGDVVTAWVKRAGAFERATLVPA